VFDEKDHTFNKVKIEGDKLSFTYTSTHERTTRDCPPSSFELSDFDTAKFVMRQVERKAQELSRAESSMIKCLYMQP
jgi:hypothetical protein